MHDIKKNEFDPRIISLEKQLRNFIRDRLGIIMHDHQQYELFKTIDEACIKFKLTPDEYIIKLNQFDNQSILLEHLISGITVGETYFFRDKQQMDLLQNTILPELIKNKMEDQSNSLRIWSAGCATGEEIYTIAMILNELIPDIDQWTIKLLATDINTTAIQKALLGSYSEWSMRSISDYYKSKYFKKENHRYKLINEKIPKVNFDYLNLNDDSYPSIFNSTNAQDLIICRNVLIYIDNESTSNIMHRLNKCLVNNGYLMLGASDPVNISKTDLAYQYRKGSLLSKTIETQKMRPRINNDTTLRKKTIKKICPIVKTVSNKTPYKVDNKNIDGDTLVKNAIELANSGNLDEAIQKCLECIKIDPTNTINYFTYGLALSELNKLDESESAFRKAIFLDNQFVAAHFQLGMLLIRKNQQALGLKSLQNALKIAEQQLPDDAVPGSPGICFNKLAYILRNEISLYVTEKI